MADPAARILVVDDNPDNRDLLCRRLSRKGYEADPAEDGPTALAALQKQRYDLILLDIRMPGMDGIEVLERIRESHGKLQLPVVMVTAETDSAQVVRAIGLGANDYITKPIDFPVVLARVESQLAMKAELAASREPPVVVATSHALEVGFVLDERYEIGPAIGHGGFAVVYQGVQLSTGQNVAVKVMRADRLRPDELDSELARFQREIRMIQRISHPNIVRLIDSGELRLQHAVARVASDVDPLGVTRVSTVPRTASARGVTEAEVREIAVPYLVTELLKGENLQQVIKREGKIPLQQLLEIMLPILSAVDAAHAAGIVHRDLTPANIFLAGGHRGVQPRVLDFGIAKLAGDQRTDTTATSSIVGTPSYMSPEQASGSRELTGASDQYTLAAVLYECATGHRPYSGESFISILQQVANAEFAPPRRHAPELPARFEDVLLRAMEADPKRRYPNTSEMGRDLLPLASDQVRAQWEPVFSP